MSVDPVLIGGAVAAIMVVSAAAYATLTNGEAAVDVDGDGDDDIVFGDDDTEGDTVDLSADGTADVSGSTGGGGTSGATLEDVIVHDDLTIIDGVGPATEANLQAAGFDTVEDVAGAPLSDLTEAEGIGEARASSIAMGAAQALNEAE